MHGLSDGLGIDVQTLDLDTAVMAYLLDPGERKYDLEQLALRFLELELTSPDREEGTLDLDGEAAPEETGRRAIAVLRLAGALADGLEARELTELYETVERPLVRVLVKMEAAGIKMDREFLEALRSELQDQCDDLERKIHTHAGEPFVVNSVPQLRRILFEKLELTPVKRTKTGPSTDADSLEKMAAAKAHPILDDLMRYREVEKLRSTYADALPPLIGEDGRIHATFNQIATTTGRISSENPNLQNIPVRSEGGREMRRAFIADAGSGLLAADYSQIELRVLAHLAEDPGLIDAFARSADVHTITAAKVFDVDEDKVDAFQRRFAKVVNYGLAFGMEAYGLGQRLNIPTDQAREILDSYFESFPNVHEFMERTVAEAKQRGYTTTILGRRRQISELASDNFRIRQMGERMAQNAPVQGSAADIFKLAMVELDRELDDAGPADAHDPDRARRARLRGSARRARRDRAARARGDGVGHRAAGAAGRRPRLRTELGAKRSSELLRRRRDVVRAGPRSGPGRSRGGRARSSIMMCHSSRSISRVSLRRQASTDEPAASRPRRGPAPSGAQSDPRTTGQSEGGRSTRSRRPAWLPVRRSSREPRTTRVATT